MITKEQRVKILAVYNGTHERIIRILSHFNIVDNVGFETSVFLFALAGISFVKDKDEIMETIGGELKLYSFEEAGSEAVKRRLKLYGKAADHRFSPCGFWSPISVDAMLDRPTTQMLALYGDFLVCPSCVENYGSCQWPLLHPRDMTVFSQIFITRVLAEVYRFIAAIAEVLV